MATDHISRDAAIDFYCSECWGRGNCKIFGDCNDVKPLREIPAADVRPVVRARWIEIDDYALCPKCGTAEHSPNRNFCHTCGADMRETEK